MPRIRHGSQHTLEKLGLTVKKVSEGGELGVGPLLRHAPGPPQALGRADCSGDGTGYSLTVRKHYATEVQKLKDRMKSAKKSLKKKEKMGFIYSFALMDLDTRLYIGYGTSFKSEKDAFLKAMKF